MDVTVHIFVYKSSHGGRQRGIDATTTLVTYMFRVIDPVHHDQLRDKVRQLGPHAEEIAMTIAEQWHEEGRQEGRVEGIAKGREEGRIAALLSQLRVKFGPQAMDAAVAAHLRAATPAALEHYLERVLGADKLAAVFED